MKSCSKTPKLCFSSQAMRLAAAAAKSLQSCPTLCDPIDVRDLLESGKFLDFPGG